LKARIHYPVVVAENCALWYPPKVFDSTRIEYRPGKTEYVPVEAEVDCDTVKKGIVKVPCPPHEKSTDTIYIEKYRVEENTAAIEAEKGKTKQIQKQYEQAIQDATQQKGKAKTYQILFFILAGYSVLRVFLRMYLKINLP